MTLLLYNVSKILSIIGCAYLLVATSMPIQSIQHIQETMTTYECQPQEL